MRYFLVVLPVGAIVQLRIVVPSLYHKYIASPQVGGNGTIHYSNTIAIRSCLTCIVDTSLSMMTILDLTAFFILMQANLVSNEYDF